MFNRSAGRKLLTRLLLFSMLSQDLQSEPCTIEYTLNGESLGVAFEFAQEELGEAALFPHIMSKNLSFKVNFGQLEQNLLTDLKAKPKKKKQEEVKPAETENEKVVEEKEPEAKTEVETTEPLEGEKVEKEGEEEATPTAAQEEEKPAEEVTESAPETVAEEEQSKPEEQETKDAEIEAAPAADVPSENVDMAVAEEEKKEGEEEAETEATTKPAEEVKEVVEEEKEEDEPLPEINRENLPGFIFIGLVEKEQLVAGPLRPESRKECEVIMMIGLSGAGKTKWVQDFVAEHPEKGYIVLGASALIDRMKVSGNGEFLLRVTSELTPLPVLFLRRTRTWAERSNRRDVVRGCRSCARAVWEPCRTLPRSGARTTFWTR